MPEQLGPASSGRKRPAEPVDKLEEGRDGGPNLVAAQPPPVAREREQVAVGVHPIQELGEQDEAAPDRRLERRRDRPAAKKPDEIENAVAKALHPVADRRPRDTVLLGNVRNGILAPHIRASDLDHVHGRRRLARQRLVRE